MTKDLLNLSDWLASERYTAVQSTVIKATQLAHLSKADKFYSDWYSISFQYSSLPGNLAITMLLPD